MGDIFRNVWEISLFSLAVILPLGVCSNLLGRRYGVKWRYLLWVVVAARLAVPIQFSLPEPMAGLRMNLPAPAVSAEYESQEFPAQAMPAGAALQQGDGTAIPVEGFAMPNPTLSVENMEKAAESKAGFPRYLAGHLELLWLAGALTFLSWQICKYAAFRRMLRRNSRKMRDAAILDCFYSLCRETGLEKRPALYFCGALPSPLCIGLFRQEIYINSEDREPEDTRLILKHELAHCCRGDLWFKALLLLARTLHFFNPFVHWMARLAERDMEYSCDVSVMQDCTLEERQAYSMAILRTVREGRQTGAVLTTAFSGGKRELKTRFENIFDMGAKKRGIALFMAAALAACGGTAFVGCQRERDTAIYGDYTEEIVTEIYRAKPVSWDDEAAARNLAELLPVPKGAAYHLEGTAFLDAHRPADGDVPPAQWLGFTINWEDTPETVYSFEGERFVDDRWNQIHAMLFLALVDDIDAVQFSLMEGNGSSRGQSFSREDMERYFGKTDLRSFASDEETFRVFVLAVNKYFYHSIDRPEEIHALGEMDSTAAQERMARFLDEAGAGIIYGDYTSAKVHRLYEAKLDYIGNASGVGRILGLMPYPDGVTGSGEGMELFTGEEPYGARMYLECSENTEICVPMEQGTWADTRWFDIQAMIFLALVDNADYLEYSLDLSETDASMTMVQKFSRENAKQFFGEEDLRSFAADEGTFCTFVLALNRYFYEGIDTPEEMMALYDLDEASSTQRMKEIFYASRPGGDMAGQMRQAEALLRQVAGQNKASSNPLDYTKCKEYEELVGIGQPALRYCLRRFAMGEAGDTLEGYIMMYACADIMGGERPADGITPTEWYFYYTAVDSMVCAPFAYDEDIYTVDLEEYAFRQPGVERSSILAAGKDERLRAVYDAISTRYNSNADGGGHCTTVFAPEIYEMKEEDSRLSAYMILRASKLALIHMNGEGYELYEQGIFSNPVRLDFERQDGEWALEEWKEVTMDDGAYLDAVEEMCKDVPGLAERLYSRSYGNEKMILWQNIVYYMNAYHGGMEIPVYYDTYLEAGEMAKVNEMIYAVPY